MHDMKALDRGIAAHAWWKYRLFDAVRTGKSEWTVKKVSAAEDCDFARWLAELSPEDRSSEHFEKVAALHAQFHAAAADVLSLVLSGRSQEAKQAIALGSHFSLISTNLTMAMSAWKDSLTG